MADYSTWADLDAFDEDNKKLGSIDSLYLDDDSDKPTWATVKSAGLFGSKLHFVPVSLAHENDGGVQFMVSEAQVKSAPSIDADSELSEADEATLYRHYDVASKTGGSQVDDDGAITRSEEQLHIGKETHAVAKARLRKYIVTEEVHTTVPLSHEEVRLEREPITADNMGDAVSSAELSEEEHEVTLNAERAVVTKETVPVERVKLSKNVVTEDVAVNDSVRKEQIEMAEPAGDTPSR